VGAIGKALATLSTEDGYSASISVKHRLSIDIVSVFGSRTLVTFLGTITGVFLARTLGPHDRGLLALVLLFPATLVMLAKLGIPQANVYCVRREGAPIEAVTTNSIWLSVGLGAVIGVLAWILRGTLLTTIMRDVPAWALLVALWRFPLVLLDDFFSSVLQAINNFAIYNTRTIIGGLMVLVLTVALWMAGWLNFTGAVLVYAAANTVILTSLIRRIRRLIPFGLRPDWGLFSRQMRFGLKSYVQVLTMHLLFRSDVYMVAYFLGPAQTAFYSLALHLAEMILEVPQAVGWVVYPRLASLADVEAHRLTAQACRRTVLLASVGGMGLVVLGPFIVTVLYGRAYAPAAGPLPFVVLGIMTLSVFTIITRNFTSRNNQQINIRAGAVALVSNVALNVFLIPLMGIKGAALATSIAYSIAAVMVLIPYRRESGMGVSELLLPTTEDIHFVWSVGVGMARRFGPALST
jgi:O-antigen/teichoic acid export membrane protein